MKSEFLLYVGTFSNAIVMLSMYLNGTMELVATYTGKEVLNPTWLSINKNRTHLYANRESSDPAEVASYTIDEFNKSQLTLVNNLDIKSNGPCHIQLLDHTIITSDYNSGYLFFNYFFNCIVC